MPVRYRGQRMSSSFSLGDIVNGRYRLTAHIISSPTADVFRADDLSLTRPVAIHVAPHSLANDSQFLQSFRDEATAVAALNHPHILRVYDWGEEAGGAYLVTEFPVGGTLRTVLDRDGQMDETKAALMGLEIADGLAYAHARGMVHGALSPETIHFDIDGRAKIADFGFTTAIANSHIGPSTDIRYASPEQAQRTDGRTDVYSLSLIIFEAITGTIPHAQATPAETLTARIGAPLPSDPRIKSLDMVLAQAGAYDAKFRLDAATMTTRLHSIVGTMPSVPTFASTMPPPPSNVGKTVAGSRWAGFPTGSVATAWNWRCRASGSAKPVASRRWISTGLTTSRDSTASTTSGSTGIARRTGGGITASGRNNT